MYDRVGRVVKLDRNMNLVKEYVNAREAAAEAGCYPGRIYERVKTTKPYHGYYYWKKSEYDEYLADKKEAEKPVEPIVKADMIQVNLIVSGKVESLYIPVYRQTVEYR